MASQPRRYALAVASFYTELAERLEAGARRALDEAGVEEGSIDRLEVPGAFELPLVALTAARSGRYLGVICLGAVVRGETDHYEYVCGAAAYGVQRAGLETGIPCAFGVLTCDTQAQALERSGDDHKNQGYRAARAAIEAARTVAGINK